MARAQTASNQAKPPVITVRKKTKNSENPNQKWKCKEPKGLRRRGPSAIQLYMAISIGIDSCHNSSKALLVLKCLKSARLPQETVLTHNSESTQEPQGHRCANLTMQGEKYSSL